MKDPSVVATQARELADRLRALPESRWLRLEDGRTVAERGLEIAQLLADLGGAPAGHRVPDLGPFAVPDQLAVTATDLAQADGVPDPATLGVVLERMAALGAPAPKR